ncbi:MAG: PKD domain-containing protein [Candidatus Sumerlaeota bacterium]|nr:PKD domain-containing protein [Candidatus Sumerlaeota bacterium]
MDPGAGNGTPIPSLSGSYTSSTETGETTMSVTGLPPGPHLIYIRARASNGVWGTYPPQLLYVYQRTKVTAAECYIDADPGPGAGTPLSAVDGNFSNWQELIQGQVTSSGLSGGEHTLSVRARSAAGVWGLANSTSFTVTGTTVTAMECYVDTDPGTGSGLTATPDDGAFDSGVEAGRWSLNTTGLAPGAHLLYIRARASNGAWGTDIARLIYVYAQTNIAYAEYYVDADPGLGSATPLMPVDGALNAPYELLTALLATDALSFGDHTIYIRARDSRNVWGPACSIVFEKRANRIVAGAEYGFGAVTDTAPGGAATAMEAEDFPFDSPVENVIAWPNAPSPAGHYRAFIRAYDSGGLWGPWTPQDLFVGTQFGSLKVTIQPPEAVAAGAQWQVDRGDWRDSATSVALPIGTYPVTLKHVRGWDEPLTQTAVINLNQLTQMTVTYTPAPPVAIVTDVNSMAVPENGTTTFNVRLSQQPTHNITVSVTMASGDPDLTVQSGATLLYTPTTWDVWQTVTLHASADADSLNGVGVARCSAPDLDNKDVAVSEIDDDPLLVVTPDALDFGPVQLGGSVDQIFIARNDGGGTINGSASVSGGGFSIVGSASYSLAHSDSTSITVRFAPIARGLSQKNVHFTGGGGADRAVSGTGQAYVSDQSFTIDRDYNQACLVVVTNDGAVAQDFMLELATTDTADLTVNFTGVGSEDTGYVSVPAGGQFAVRLMVHAPDATRSDYTLPVVARVRLGAAVTNYTARVFIHVRKPDIWFSFEEIETEPHTMVKTLRVTNLGADTLTDLRIAAGPALADLLVFQPNVEHGKLDVGHSLIVQAIPDLNLFLNDPTHARIGAVTATAGGSSETLILDFTCSQSLYQGKLYNQMITALMHDWYCTNRPVIESYFNLPSGFGHQNITKANVAMYFEPQSGWVHVPHTIRILLNGYEVGRLSNIIPRGAYEFEVPTRDPATGLPWTPFILPLTGVARNTLRLEMVGVNPGHYVVATDFHVVLAIDEVSLAVYASSQAEANQYLNRSGYFQPQPRSWDLGDVEIRDSIGALVAPDGIVTPGAAYTVSVTAVETFQEMYIVVRPDNGDPAFLLLNSAPGVYKGGWRPERLSTAPEGRCVLSVYAGACHNGVTTTSVIIQPGVLQPGFTGDPLNGQAPLSVQFTDQTLNGPPTTWTWTFGDGGTSGERNPVHTYTLAGTFDVSLTVDNGAGPRQLLRPGYVTVGGAPPARMGSLRVNLGPTSAVLAGAQWRVDGGSWLDSGASVAATAGDHALDFKPMSPGWIAPSGRSVSVAENLETVVAVDYAAPQVAPNKPSNLSPAAAATSVSLTPTLVSSAFSPGQTGDTHAGSQWQIRSQGGSSSFERPVYDSGFTAARLTQCPVPAGLLNYGAGHYWRLRHLSSNGLWSAWSNVTGFTTVAGVRPPVAPDRPRNLWPPDGQQNLTRTPRLRATPFSDGDAGDAFASSQWRIRTEAGAYTAPAYDTAATTEGATMHDVASGALTADTSYYWQVRYCDSRGLWSLWSAETGFRTAPPPVLTAPEGLQASGGPTSVWLTWLMHRDYRAAGYQVYRAAAKDGPYAPLSATLIRDDEYLDAYLTPGAVFFYKVAALTAEGAEGAMTEPVEALVGQARIWMTDLRGAPGTTVSQRLTLSNPNQLSNESLDVRVDYDPALLRPISVARAWLTSGFTLTDNCAQATGTLVIRGAATGAVVTGEGNLFDVTYLTTNSAPYWARSALGFAEASFTDAQQRAVNVDHTATGSLIVAAPALPGDLNGDGQITRDDVALLSQIVNRRVTPSAAQMEAGELSGDGVIDAADLVLLLRLFLAGGASDPARDDSGPRLLASATTHTLRWGSVVWRQNTFAIPLLLDEAEGVAGLDIVLRFDPALLRVASVARNPSAAFSEWRCDADDGQIRIVAGAPQAFAGGGMELATLTFEGFGRWNSTQIGVAKLKLSGAHGDDIGWTRSIQAQDVTVESLLYKILKHLHGKETAPAPADVNGDGVIDISDLIFLLQY